MMMRFSGMDGGERCIGWLFGSIRCGTKKTTFAMLAWSADRF